MLDRYIRLPYIYQSKIGYDALIQNVIPKEVISLMATTITDLDIEFKRKLIELCIWKIKPNQKDLKECGNQFTTLS